MADGINGKDMVEALKKKFEVRTDPELATTLGITTGTIQSWKSKPKLVTARAIVGLVNAVKQAGADELRKSAISPVVEFFPIEECASRHGKNWELFSVHKNGAERLYGAGLRKELQLNHGGVSVL